MAGIMHKTSRLMAAVLLGCLLAGCGGNTASAEKPDSTPTEASGKGNCAGGVFYRAGCRLHGHTFDQ